MQTETIVYFKHGIGNMIMFSPAIQALALQDKSKRVDVCMSSFWDDKRRAAYDEYFSLCPFVQDVVNYPEQSFVKKYTRWFYSNHGEASEALEVFRNQGKPTMSLPLWGEKAVHEIFWYMNSVDLYGNAGVVPGQFVPLTELPVLAAKNFKIGICNGTYCNKMKGAKQWPYFKELVDLLKRYYDCTIYKLGYGDELKDVDNVDVDYVGKLSFCESAKAVSQLDLFITSDTGLMHAGDALGVNMVVIFGGSLISKNGAISKNAVNMTAGLDCQPCQRTLNFYNCPHYDCLVKLGVDRVMDEVRKRCRR